MVLIYSLCLSFIFIQLIIYYKKPFQSILLLLFLSMISSLFISSINFKVSRALILFLIFSGGVMIIFIYSVSLCPELSIYQKDLNFNMIFLENMMKFLLFFSLSLLLIFTVKIFFYKIFNLYSEMTFMIVGKLTRIFLFLIMYLLLILFIAVNMSINTNAYIR